MVVVEEEHFIRSSQLETTRFCGYVYFETIRRWDERDSRTELGNVRVKTERLSHTINGVET